MSNSILRADGVAVKYGLVTVLSHFSLAVEREEFVAIVGPSGCGKTTLLNLLSGFIRPSEGRVMLGGKARTVYQRDGLFPWLTVQANIAIGLPRDMQEEERATTLRDALAVMGLQAFAGHYPHELSGGMRQRTELARAWVSDSEILLMDEPFCSLDYLTRLRLRHELSSMLAKRPRTVVLVTHDIEEAAHLADRIVVLSERPAKIRFQTSLDLERPRDLAHPVVVETMQRVLAELGLESIGVAS